MRQWAKHKYTSQLYLLGIGIWFCVSTQADAQVLTEKLPNGLPAHAEYIEKDPNKPAIVVLHGFLQTYDFLATRNIINGLSNLDYSVLAPNLSFGIPGRKQSMQCQAAHKHTLQGDLKEIAFWSEWLRQKGHPSIILVGHSWGSQHSLGFVSQYQDIPVSAIVAISLVRSEGTPESQKQQIALAKQRLDSKSETLDPYQLGFCKNFMASPDSFLSYALWDDDYVIEVLQKLSKRDLNIFVILGGKDRRIDEGWIKKLHAANVHLTVINGANHFFSHVFEFELNDQLEVILERLEKNSR